MKKIVPFLSSALMCAMCFADIVIDEGKEYVIPDSGEVTISEKLTGKGAVRYTGGGTLILTNGGDWSGSDPIDRKLLIVRGGLVMIDPSVRRRLVCDIRFSRGAETAEIVV